MKTIYFEDHGQDFLEWDIDDEGFVVDCRPAQSDIWNGHHVLNHSSLKKGDKVLRDHEDGTTDEIKYPLEKVSLKRIEKETV